jgi:hypothetical protein
MTERKATAFSSPDLQQAMNEARSTLEGFDDARNRVSRDIKQLESYLEGLDLKTRFHYRLGKMIIDKGDRERQNIPAALEFGGSASGTIEEEAIVWTEDTRSARFRLMYELTEWDGSVELDVPGGPYFWDESTAQREVKPLIETRFEIRKRLYGRLPDFVRALSSHLAVEGLGASISLDDPPPANLDIPF